MIKLSYGIPPIENPLIPDSELYPCIPRQMTAEERERYGPPNPRIGKGKTSFAPRRRP